MHRADIYDINSNTWKRAASSNLKHNGVKMITMGNRVFAIGGDPSINVLEEYHAKDDSWSLVPETISFKTRFIGLTSVPAMFFNIVYKNCSGIPRN